jgi:galactose mutarotase-like enzyme
MKRIEIFDKASGLAATVLPDYGGMVCSLNLKGNEILRFKPELLSMGNSLAGGIPILFPFCGATENDEHEYDEYVYNGKRYTMPGHGFIKDMSFSIEERTEQSITIFTKPNEIIKNENYPFDFVLYINYKVDNGILHVKATIENNTSEKMPHNMGWHPYFKTTNKEQTYCMIDMKFYKDTFDDTETECSNHVIDLTQELDRIYWGKKNSKVFIKSVADNYSAQINMDEFHDVITICTIFSDCVCIEPWTGVPNSLNTGKGLKFVEGNSAVTCGFEIIPELLKNNVQSAVELDNIDFSNFGPTVENVAEKLRNIRNLVK